MLQRTAENKYYRQSTSTTPTSWSAAFRRRARSCSPIAAMILGSVEAASFSPDQLRMLADFVNKRGGGLLMLGGRRSFAEGGWGGTPVGEVLPVVHRQRRATRTVLLRAAGEADARRRDLSGDADRRRRKGVDARSGTTCRRSATVNAIRLAKPGATVLLTGADNRKQDQIVLAYQRYGRGKAIAMPIQDSWLWKMDAKMAVTDTTHATFWRRLVRWLVDGVPDQVEITTAADRVEPGEADEAHGRGRRRGLRRSQRQPRRRPASPRRRARSPKCRSSGRSTQGRRVPRARSCRTNRASTRSR